MIRSFAGIFAFGEDTHSLRLKSELFDLRSGYANPAPLALWFGILYSTAKGKKNDHPMMVVFLWQGNRDSNPKIQSQSLLCYRYTIPLFSFLRKALAFRAYIYYHKKFGLSIAFC